MTYVNLERGKVFSARACRDVHIILSDLNGVACECTGELGACFTKV